MERALERSSSASPRALESVRRRLVLRAAPELEGLVLGPGQMLGRALPDRPGAGLGLGDAAPSPLLGDAGLLGGLRQDRLGVVAGLLADHAGVGFGVVEGGIGPQGGVLAVAQGCGRGGLGLGLRAGDDRRGLGAGLLAHRGGFGRGGLPDVGGIGLGRG